MATLITNSTIWGVTRFMSQSAISAIAFKRSLIVVMYVSPLIQGLKVSGGVLVVLSPNVRRVLLNMRFPFRVLLLLFVQLLFASLKRLLRFSCRIFRLLVLYPFLIHQI